MTRYITRIYKANSGFLRVKIKSSKPIFDKNGVKVGDQPPVYAEFDGGVFETNDKEVIEKLESMPSFGVDFWKDDGKTAKSVAEAEEKSTEEESESEKEAEDELEGKTRQELLQIAKDKELEVDSKATKKELLELLKK